MKTIFKKAAAELIILALALVTIFPAISVNVNAASKSTYAQPYPWSKVAGGTTGDYIADSYDNVGSGHVFESVTQERLLDILSSTGNYYIVFGGPEHETSQAVLSTINAQAKANGITKIYHFDPYIDGYQIDITKNDSEFKTANGTSVNQLWTRITDLLPDGAPIDNYNSSDTLLFAYKNDGSTPQITASYSLKDAAGFDSAAASAAVADVFRGGVSGDPVISSSIRSDFAFFKRVYNASATYFNYNSGNGPTSSKTGATTTELFTDADETGFVFHQVNFVELLNILNSPGDHIIFFGASWCHNTQAIIKSVEEKAKQYGHQTVYVYDTTLGNQLTFGTGTDINKVISTSSAFNSRNNVDTSTGNGNISYLYGELVKYLGDYITENNSNKNNSITYYPNGNITGSATSTVPWESGTNKNAIRLQLPFLISYNKDAEDPVTKQWLHKNFANDGTYMEYMLELAWVLKTPEALAATNTRDGLSLVDFASEAVQALDNVLKPVSTAPVQYSVLSNFTTFTGSGDVTARIDADATKFVRLLYNGQVVDQENYTVESGSTIITLKESYLKTLGNGTHNFVAEFTDGTAALTLNINTQSGTDAPVNSPATGDSNNSLLWILTGIVSLAGVSIFVFHTRRQRSLINK